MKKRLIGLYIIITMTCSLMPITAQAEIVNSGQCGDNAYWELNSTGTLIISGEGDLYDNNSPWYSVRDNIKNIDIKQGITSIGNEAFRWCYNLKSVTISNSITSIGGFAFGYCPSLTSIIIPDSVTSIGSYTFTGCSGLKNITIGKRVTNISSDVFTGCENLEVIDISNNSEYLLEDGILFDKKSLI